MTFSSLIEQQLYMRLFLFCMIQPCRKVGPPGRMIRDTTLSQDGIRPLLIILSQSTSHTFTSTLTPQIFIFLPPLSSVSPTLELIFAQGILGRLRFPLLARSIHNHLNGGFKFPLACSAASSCRIICQISKSIY